MKGKVEWGGGERRLDGVGRSVKGELSSGWVGVGRVCGTRRIPGPQWPLGNTHHIEAVIVHEGFGLSKQEG